MRFDSKRQATSECDVCVVKETSRREIKRTELQFGEGMDGGIRRKPKAVPPRDSLPGIQSQVLGVASGRILRKWNMDDARSC
jgi:hypothetical protein